MGSGGASSSGRTGRGVEEQTATCQPLLGVLGSGRCSAVLLRPPSLDWSGFCKIGARWLTGQAHSVFATARACVNE